jgi:hypothetical protein
MVAFAAKARKPVTKYQSGEHKPARLEVRQPRRSSPNNEKWRQFGHGSVRCGCYNSRHGRSESPTVALDAIYAMWQMVRLVTSHLQH